MSIRKYLFLNSISDEARERIVGYADGDARRLLNLIEQLADAAEETNRSEIDAAFVKQTLTQSLRRFDKGGDQFYDQISALHKSVRGSSPDAALYWMVRMLDGGADLERFLIDAPRHQESRLDHAVNGRKVLLVHARDVIEHAVCFRIELEVDEFAFHARERHLALDHVPLPGHVIPDGPEATQQFLFAQAGLRLPQGSRLILAAIKTGSLHPAILVHAKHHAGALEVRHVVNLVAGRRGCDHRGGEFRRRRADHIAVRYFGRDQSVIRSVHVESATAALPAAVAF